MAVATLFDTATDEFKVRLAVYGITSNLPTGIPGDPSKDYRRNSSTTCGTFQSPLLTDAGKPYAFCPLPGQAPSDPIIRECCRHYAYAVPYAKFGLAQEDRVTTIIVSPRLFLLPEKQWKAILAHELGHAVDFYLFGSRYRLRNRKVKVPKMLAEKLEAVNREIDDPELRADVLGEMLVLVPLMNKKLCYDPVLTLQAMVEPDADCSGGTAGEGGGAFMRHYTHDPIQTYG